ncbi:MAG TPA: hypothetical protein VJ810_29370 [Blastocatellia bacterium]|nr:hypothetical protein [Blastocatellia bacterium]
MNRIFAITTASDRIPTGGDGRGEVTFTVTNSSKRALRGKIRVRPLGLSKSEWFNIAGESERNFSPNATQQVLVKVTVPPGTAAGKYQFRLDTVSLVNPDDDFTEGPTVDLEIKATEAPKKPFPWWIVAVAAAGLLLIGWTTWWFLSRGDKNVVLEENFDNVKKDLKKAWSVTKTEVTPTGSTRFLGQFFTESVKLTLDKLPTHKTVTVTFDLYVTRSWDGETPGAGPDVWGLNMDDGVSLIKTTFSNQDAGKQAYACKDGEDASTGCYSKGAASTFGAAAINSLGYDASLKAKDCVYKIKRTFDHDKSSLVLTFFSDLKEGAGFNNTSNEAWGLDNVRIEVK